MSWFDKLFCVQKLKSRSPRLILNEINLEKSSHLTLEEENEEGFHSPKSKFMMVNLDVIPAVTAVNVFFGHLSTLCFVTDFIESSFSKPTRLFFFHLNPIVSTSKVYYVKFCFGLEKYLVYKFTSFKSLFF